MIDKPLRNVRVKLRDDGKLALIIDLSAEGEPTKTGRSTKIAYGDGNFVNLGRVDERLDGLSLMIMLLRSAPKPAKTAPNSKSPPSTKPKSAKARTR